MRKFIVPAALVAAIWTALPGWGLWKVLAHPHVYDGTTGAPAGTATWLDFYVSVGIAAWCTAMYLIVWVARARARARARREHDDLGQGLTPEERGCAAPGAETGARGQAMSGKVPWWRQQEPSPGGLAMVSWLIAGTLAWAAGHHPVTWLIAGFWAALAVLATVKWQRGRRRQQP